MRPLSRRPGASRWAVRRLIALAGAVAALLVTPTALADDGETNNFTGSCELRGSVKYPDEPLTAVPTPLSAFIRATGKCVGEFDGEPLDGDEVVLEADLSGVYSCEAGELSGPATLGFRGKELHARLVTENVAGVVSSELFGEQGGAAAGPVTPQIKLDQAIRKCQGNGLRNVRFEYAPVGSLSG